MFFNVIGKCFKQISFLLIVISVFSQIAVSNEVTVKNTLKIEEKAKSLSRDWNAVAYRNSIDLFIDAARNWKELGDAKRASFCLNESAKLLLLTSDLDQMQKVLNKALSIDKNIQNIEGQVISHALFSQLFERLGETKKSKTHYKKAIRLSENSTVYSKALANYIAGEIEFVNVEFENSQEFFEKANKFAEDINDYDLKAKIILKLGIIDAILDKHIEALAKINQAKSIWKSTENKRGLGLVENAFGFAFVIINEKQKALDHYHKAKLAFPKNIEFLETATTFSGIATLHLNYSQNQLAENNFAKAYKIFEEIDYENGQLNIIPPLARLIYLRGDHKASKELYERGLFLANKLNNQYFVSTILEQYGLMDLDEGKLDEALEKFNKVALTFKSAGINLPRIRHSIGKIYFIKGDYETAKKHFTYAYNKNKNLKDDVHLTENIFYLAKISKETGNIRKALKQSAEAIENAKSLYDDVGNHSMRKSYHSKTYELYEFHIDLLMTLHKRFPDRGFEIDALKINEESSSRVMRENLQMVDFNFKLDADLEMLEKKQKLTESLAEKKEELSELSKTPNKKGAKELIELHRSEIAEIEEQIQNVIATLRQNSPVYSAIKESHGFDLANFQENILDNDTLLIEFFFGKEKSYMWVVDKDQTEVFYLPEAEILNDSFDELLKLLFSNEKRPKDNISKYQELAKKSEAEYWKKAFALSEVIFGPITNKIVNKRLLIVRDGKMNYFPLEALPNPSILKNTWLLETNEIIYQPSATMLSLQKLRKQNQKKPTKDFLVFSDPVFSLNDTRLKDKKIYNAKNSNSTFDQDFKIDDSINTLERLEASEYEVNSIFKYFDSDYSEKKTSFTASREQFINTDLSDYKMLHFATHGRLNKEYPNLSGIVLSNFDEVGNKQNDLIGLQEISGLNLATDVVVLSACDSGVGENIRGEGLQSLTNGFLQVGAKSVISSHWKVADNAALELMDNFYKKLATENVTSSQALRKAKIKMLKNPNYSFPYYWASFTIHGDFENKPELRIKNNRTEYLLILLFIVLLLSAAVLIRKSFQRKII